MPSSPSLLIDFRPLDETCCHDAFEVMAKALTEGNDHPAMWRPLENPFAEPVAADVTRRFQAILRVMQATLTRFLGGHASELRKANTPWLRWDAARFDQVRARLEGLDPAQMSLADYQLLIDFLIQFYLPDGVIEDEATFLAIRAALMGKIQANIGRTKPAPTLLESIASLLPTQFAHIPPKILTPRELAMLRWGKAHAAENIRHVTEQARHRMATIVLETVQGGMLGQKEGTWAHAKGRLFDEFAALNRDFRRIAITETGEIVNQGFVGALQPGRKVRRIEAYANTCSWCKEINGKVYNVVSPDDPNRNGDTDVWVGKNQIGRSASPMKRVGDRLIERPASERWWVSSGVQHPNCRGGWLSVTDKPVEVSEDFFRMLQATLDAAA